MTTAADSATIKVAIVYNPFAPHEIETHELPYVEGATIADYIGDLGEEHSWSVGFRDEAHDVEAWPNLTPTPGETFSMVRIPESGGRGGGGKDILRTVAMIAVMVVSMTVLGPMAAGLAGFTTGTTSFAIASAVAASTFTAAGMMVINAILPPAEPKQSNGDGESYGIDGPKNTSREGIVVPVVFGKYRVGGNIVDLYTKNIGDDQYLFMRTVVNDGRVKSIGEFEINDQPISNFANVETRVSLGTEEGEENDWFGESVRMVNRGVKLDTSWTVHTTQSDVDRLRIDLLYPQGLAFYKSDGRVLAAESDIAFEYRAVGSSTWQPLGSSQERRFIGYASGVQGMPGVGSSPPVAGGSIGTVRYAQLYTFDEQNQIVDLPPEIEFVGANPNPVVALNPSTGTNAGAVSFPVPAASSRVTLTALAEVEARSASSTGSFDLTFAYREVGAPGWTVIEREVGSVERTRTDSEWGAFPIVYRTASINLDPAKSYEVAAFGGTLTNGSAFGISGNGIINLLRAKESAFRYSYESGILPRGRYEVRVRRLRPIEDNPKRVDEVYLQDVAEIDVDNIHYVGTANVSLKIKLGETLSSVSKFTCMVEGAIVKQFDEDGVVVAEDWSPWPADHVLDILMNQDRGRSIPASRIDFAAYKEWRDHCIANNLKFNGIFDSKTNVWDATQTILRVGHAQMVRVGTRYSFVVDKRTEPVMLFDDSTMFTDTFATTWLPVNERANEIQYTFYPEEDGFAEKMIRVVDPYYTNSGTGTKVAQIREIGVTSYEQARYNIEKQLRENREIKKAVSFEAPLSAIGLSIGDVAVIQHTSANYGNGVGGGLTEAGSSTTTLKLDRPITMQSGKAYRALVFHPAVKRYDVQIENVVGSTLYVSGLPSGEVERCRRLIRAGKDVAVRNIVEGSPFDRVIVDDAAGITAGPAELFDTEVIEERDVIFAAGEVEEVVLTAPLSVAPERHSPWLVGPVESVRSTFRLRGIEGDGIHRRKLSFIQYEDSIYDPLNAVVVPPDSGVGPVPPHVRNLAISYPPSNDGSQTRLTISVSWSTDDERYSGADIYASIDGGDWFYFRTVSGNKSFESDFRIGADVQFRVVAIGSNGRRASVLTAPVVGTVVNPNLAVLLRPMFLSAALDSFDVNAAITVRWSVVSRPDGLRNSYRVQVRQVNEAEFDLIQTVDWDIPTFTSPPIDLGDNAEGWTTVGVTDEPFLTILRLQASKLVVRVRTEFGSANSPYSYLKFNLEAPAAPNGVTNLAVNGIVGATSFTGRDAYFSWDDAVGGDFNGSRWKDYQVTVRDSEGAVLRTEFTRNPNWTYSFDLNAQDSAGLPDRTARRAFAVEVRIRDVDGNLSAPSSLSVQNAQAALLPVTVQRSGPSASLVFNRPADTDFGGIIVWSASLSDTPDTIIHRGEGTPSILVPDAFPGQEDDPTLTIQWGFYDVFDELNVVRSQPVGLIGEPPLLPETPDLTDLRNEVDGVRQEADTLRQRLGGFAFDLTQAARTQMLASLQIVNQATTADQDAQQNRAFIEQTNRVIEDTTQSLTEQINTAISNFNGNLAGLETRLVTRVDNIESELENSFVGVVEFEDYQGAVQQQLTLQASAIEAAGNRVNLLGVESPDGSSFVLDTDKVKIDGSTSLFERLSLIEQRFGGTASSFLLGSINTATTQASAAVDTLQQMGATLGNGGAFTLDANKIRVTGSEFLNQRLTTIQSRLDATLDQPAVDARVDSKISAAIQSGGPIASFVQSAYTSKGEFQSFAGVTASSIDGLAARAALFVEAGGRIGGVNLNGSPTRIDLQFMSDTFFFTDRSSGQSTNVLSYVGGKWRFNSNIEVVAGSIDIKSATSGRRTEYANTGVKVFDDSGTLRVQLGLF